MTTKQTFWRTFVAMAAMLLTMPATMWADSTFGGGSGTLTDPYRIENPQHLRQLAAEVNDGNSFEGVYFKLTQSFSCWIEPFTPIGGKYYSTPEHGTGTHQFSGDFNGNGNTIHDLNIKPDENFYGIGLFGELGCGAHVHDLSIGNLNTSTTIMGWGNCGAIAGSVSRDAIIYNCHVKKGVVVSVDPDDCSVNSADFGGIAGENMGIIGCCTSKATVTDAGYTVVKRLGGIVGHNASEVTDCISLATVTGSDQVGGIAGNSGSGSNYDDNYFHSATPMGGVNGSDVDGAAWMGTISFDEHVTASILTAPTYSDDSVDYFGAGRTCSLGNDIKYNDGFIPIDPQLTSEQVTLFDDMQGGVHVQSFYYPHGQDVVIECSYSSLKRDIAYAPWVEIGIPEQEYTGEPLTPVITVTDNMTGNPVTLTEGVDYTVTLSDEDMVDVGEYTVTIDGIGEFAGTTTAVFVITRVGWAGEGTEEAPYQIHNLNDMLLLADEVMNADFAGTYFILMSDLDFTGVEYRMVGRDSEHRFSGCFDGNGKTINNVQLDNTNQKTGLFGWLGEGAVIKNLISGAGNDFNDLMCVGGIVGRMDDAVVKDCISYATVRATSQSTYSGRYAGGIVGNAAEGSVINCRNYGDVSALRGAGGIVGYAVYTSLSDNVNFGQTTADEKSGGIVGINAYATISNNYYAGECTTGGVEGNDVAGEAMRGYTVSGGEKVTVELVEDATVGVANEGVVYAGNEQQVVLILGSTQDGQQGVPALRAPSSTNYVASNGNLVDNEDGTWTLTMTDEDVTISVDDHVTGLDEIHAAKRNDGRRYNLMGQPVGNDYKGIVIEAGKVVIVK